MIYLIHCLTTDLVKVGMTNDVRTRFLGLRNASPTPIELVACWPGAHAQEALLHDAFHDVRDHGEWFRAGEVVAVRDRITTLLGVDPAPTPGTTVDRKRGRPRRRPGDDRPHPEAFVNDAGHWEHHEILTRPWVPETVGPYWPTGATIRVVYYPNGDRSVSRVATP